MLSKLLWVERCSSALFGFGRFFAIREKIGSKSRFDCFFIKVEDHILCII